MAMNSAVFLPLNETPPIGVVMLLSLFSSLMMCYAFPMEPDKPPQEPDPLVFTDMGKVYEVVQVGEHSYVVPEPLDPFEL